MWGGTALPTRCCGAPEFYQITQATGEANIRKGYGAMIPSTNRISKSAL